MGTSGCPLTITIIPSSFETEVIQAECHSRRQPTVSKHWRQTQLPIRNKKALISQRRPRDAPNIWVPWKVSRVLANAPGYFSEICKVLLFRSILRMCTQNLKFVALAVPEIIGGTQKIWAVPRYAHAPFSLKFLQGFCSDGPCEYICQIWSS